MVKNFEDEVKGVAVAGQIGKGIVQTIKKLEEEYQKTLESTYETVKEHHIKNLRRKLPFTGQKFNWEVPKLM